MRLIRKKLPKDNDCGCGKRVKKTDRKKIQYKKIIKKDNPR